MCSYLINSYMYTVLCFVSVEYLRNSLEFSKERDQQREKCTAALMEKNEMERLLFELKEKMSQGHQCTCPPSKCQGY